MTNVFNVYIGQITSGKVWWSYLNLCGGHIPFFLHAIVYRVLAFSFIVTYLHTVSIIPFFLIWLCNIVSGDKFFY